MKIVNTSKELTEYLNHLSPTQTIGFVPTMGALHDGHLSLLSKAIEGNDVVICTVFVNPTQFNEKSDFDSYPKVLDADIELLNTIKVDVLFAPSVAQIYPEGTNDIPFYDIGALENVLEGEHRPGHFQGVCHIIDVFLNMLKPTSIYMGEKDIQQIAVVQKLIEINDHSTLLVPCVTLREESGLAMSSRNRRLSVQGKINAAMFNKSLCHIRDLQKEKNFLTLKKEAEEMMKAVGFTPEYIALCNANTLEELSDFDQDIPMRLIAASFIEGVRLIDNIAI